MKAKPEEILKVEEVLTENQGETLIVEPEETGRVLREETGIVEVLKEKNAADSGEENQIRMVRSGTIWEKSGEIVEKAVKLRKKHLSEVS